MSRPRNATPIPLAKNVNWRANAQKAIDREAKAKRERVAEAESWIAGVRARRAAASEKGPEDEA